MTIFAVFMCFAGHGCDPLPTSPAAGPGVYRTLAECKRHLLPPSGVVSFRCLSRRVEVWR